MELDPTASRAEHESAIVELLVSLDSEFGDILKPYIDFDRLDELQDAERRRIRSDVVEAVRALLDSEDTQE